MTVLVTGGGSVTVPDSAFNEVGFVWVMMLFTVLLLMILYGRRKDAKNYPSKDVEGF